MTTLPERLKLLAAVDGRPAPAVCVALTLKMSAKNDYTVVVGPSDRDGSIVVTREQLVAWCHAELAVFAMDYRSVETQFAGTILVAPMGAAAIARAQEAHVMFESALRFPDGYTEGLAVAAAQAGRVAGQTIRVVVEEVTPPDAARIICTDIVAEPPTS